MQLLIASQSDPAGFNMATFIASKMDKQREIYQSKHFDLVLIPTPAISADWIGDNYHQYDAYVFLSKHASETGTLALTCHSTGNFSDAKFGGLPRQVAIPHPQLQKSYMQHLWAKKEDFSRFEITIEATHHGPTALNKPTLFIEVGTTQKEWTDKKLCESVAKILVEEMSKEPKRHEVAMCFGGTHYPKKFNKELIEGEFALGTVIPKHALGALDEDLFSHICTRNKEAKFALIDWSSLGQNKQKVVDLIQTTDLEMIKI